MIDIHCMCSAFYRFLHFQGTLLWNFSLLSKTVANRGVFNKIQGKVRAAET